MGATTSIMVLRGLQTGQQYSLGLYFAGGDLAGYIVPCTFNGVASATSPKDFTLPEPCSIEYVSGPATGRLTVDVNGLPTPIQIDTAVVIAQATKPGVSWGKLAGGASRRYVLRVISTMAA